MKRTDSYDSLREEIINKYPESYRKKMFGNLLLMTASFYFKLARQNNDGLVFKHMEIIEKAIEKYFRNIELKKYDLEFMNRLTNIIDNALHDKDINLAYAGIMLYKVYIDSGLRIKQFKISPELKKMNEMLKLYHLKLIKATLDLPEDKKKEWWDIKDMTDKTIEYMFEKIRYVLDIKSFNCPMIKDFTIKKYLDRDFDDIDRE